MGHPYNDTKHTHHILRHCHYVREGEEKGQLAHIWVSTDKQLADIGTKPLGCITLDYLMKFITVMVNNETSVQEG